MLFHARNMGFIDVNGTVAAASMGIEHAAQADAQGAGYHAEISAIYPTAISRHQEFIAYGSAHDQSAEFPLGKFVGGSTAGHR
jgi:hypothetical protein